MSGRPRSGRRAPCTSTARAGSSRRSRRDPPASASRSGLLPLNFGRVSASDMLVPRVTFAQKTASFSRSRGSRIGLRSGGTARPGAPGPWRCRSWAHPPRVSARDTGCDVWCAATRVLAEATPVLDRHDVLGEGPSYDAANDRSAGATSTGAASTSCAATATAGRPAPRGGRPICPARWCRAARGRPACDSSRAGHPRGAAPPRRADRASPTMRPQPSRRRRGAARGCGAR